MVVLLFLLLSWNSRGAEQFTPQAVGYKDLEGERKRLFDQLAKEAQPQMEPAEFFLSLELTDRTTFDAVTHALSRQQLTGADGGSLGRAIELVERLESVVGARRGQRGDEQFRIYCQLRPGATAILGESKEFFRDKDNSIFHRGYPVCFRSRGRMPSIQFSISRDGRRADIDVDYRSSRLPQSLFNGHLRASNSDVTAGRNHRSHNRRWQGLQAWWRSLLKEQRSEPVEAPPVQAAITLPANRVALGAEATVEDTAVEFISDWLLRRNVEEAMQLVAPNVAACTNVDDDAEFEQVGGAAARRMLERILKRGRRFSGRLEKLSDAVAPVIPWDQEYRIHEHPYAGLFTLAGLSAEEAEEYLCRRLTELNGEEAVESVDGNRYLMIFEFKRSSGVLSLLWERTPQGWRITAFDVEES